MKRSRKTGSEKDLLGKDVSQGASDPSKQSKKGASRRDFLMTTAAGAGLLFAGKALAQDAAPAAAAPPPAEPAAAAPEAAAAAPAAPPAPAPVPQAAPAIVRNIHSAGDINVGIIGLGAEGMVLTEAMLRIPGLRFQAVCDIWEYSRKRGANTLKKYGHKATPYENFIEMLDTEKDLHAVVVASPDFVHHTHSIECMRRGLDVYCEKEMSNTIENAKAMVLAARETGRLLQIGHQRRSNPRYIHAVDKLVLEHKLLGRVTHAYAQWNRAKSDDLGWPKKYEISPDVLEKYGYDSMQHFRNWRWYKKYGGGPIVDLGSHQIDIFTWAFGAPPTAVVASGGADFYTSHEWYDNVLCIFDYDTPQGTSRAFYQVLTTTSNGGFYENFMGENGTLVISEVPPRGNHLLREAHAPEWDDYVAKGLLGKGAEPAPAAGAKSKDVNIDVRVSAPLASWPIPVQFNKPAHQPHLENFFDAMRNPGIKLNCPSELAYETAVAVHRVNEAVEAGTKLHFTPEEFKV